MKNSLCIFQAGLYPVFDICLAIFQSEVTYTNTRVLTYLNYSILKIFNKSAIF